MRFSSEDVSVKVEQSQSYIFPLIIFAGQAYEIQLYYVKSSTNIIRKAIEFPYDEDLLFAAHFS